MGISLAGSSLLPRGHLFRGVYSASLITVEGRAHNGEILARAAALAEAGKWKPLLNEQSFSIADMNAAHLYGELDRIRGVSTTLELARTS